MGLTVRQHDNVSGNEGDASSVVLDQIVRTPVGKPDYRWAKEVATTGS